MLGTRTEQILADSELNGFKSRNNLKTILRLTIQVVLSNAGNGEAPVPKSAARVASAALVMVITMVMDHLRMVTVHRQLSTLLTTQ